MPTNETWLQYSASGSRWCPGYIESVPLFPLSSVEPTFMSVSRLSVSVSLLSVSVQLNCISAGSCYTCLRLVDSGPAGKSGYSRCGTLSRVPDVSKRRCSAQPPSLYLESNCPIKLHSTEPGCAAANMLNKPNVPYLCHTQITEY